MSALMPAFSSGFLACLAMVSLLHGGDNLRDPWLGTTALVASPVILLAARSILRNVSATADKASDVSEPVNPKTSEGLIEAAPLSEGGGE